MKSKSTERSSVVEKSQTYKYMDSVTHPKEHMQPVYVRSVNESGEVTVNLLSAKSRVAPIKQVSVPRLEMCGALLLTRLIDKIMPILNLEVEHIHLWTDSMIVLAWISAEPTRLQTFVANRVAEIQTLS
jgi:hypothetical protein